MPVDLPDDFPILKNHARPPARFDQAVSVFGQALAAGQIRNRDYEEAKQVLGSALDRAWTATIGAPFFHAGQWQAQPAEVQALVDAGRPSNLHETLSFAKRLGRVAGDAPVLQAIRALVAEALPLAQASAELRPLIVKGRAPSAAPPAPANPDQVRATCSCCFRGIAVTPVGKMAHHGYQRPFEGYQTQSCDGTRFPPLEVSTEGLEWLIWKTEEHRGELQDRIDRKDSLTKLTFSVRETGQVVRKSVEKGDQDWDLRFRSWEAAARSEQVYLAATLKKLGEALAHWQRITPPRPDPMAEEGLEP